MMSPQPSTTGREMVESGQWAREGRSHYRHVSGVEVVQGADRVWRSTDGRASTKLWMLRCLVEGV